MKKKVKHWWRTRTQVNTSISQGKNRCIWMNRTRQDGNPAEQTLNLLAPRLPPWAKICTPNGLGCSALTELLAMTLTTSFLVYGIYQDPWLSLADGRSIFNFLWSLAFFASFLALLIASWGAHDLSFQASFWNLGGSLPIPQILCSVSQYNQHHMYGFELSPIRAAEASACWERAEL